MNFGMGGMFANYKEKNAIRLASSQGASITFLFTLFYLIILISILFIPVFNFFNFQSKGMSISIWGLLSTTIVLSIITILFSTVFLRVGLKAFQKDI
jgi:hypothetical protein